MISIRNLSKRYGGVLAVNNLSLDIDKELFVFLGPNGAGKTTTIKMMTGLLQPTSGTVSINGYNMGTDPLRAKAEFGYVAQQPSLYEKLTPHEFIDFVASIYKVDHKTAHVRMDRLFEIFEITGRSNDMIEDLSHGTKQKLSMISALIHNPSVLFLDEPTVGLDPKASRNMKDLLRGLVDAGTTIFMSTHILEVAEIMCDRLAIISQGELIKIGTMDELRSSHGNSTDSLEHIFLQLTGQSSKSKVDEFLRIR